METLATKYDTYNQLWAMNRAYSAIVFVDGDTVIAEDGDGKVIASAVAGENDSYVIQAALNQQGLILIKGKSFIISDTLYIKSNTTLFIFPGITIARNPGSMITILKNEHWNSIDIIDDNIKILGGIWNGNKATYVSESTWWFDRSSVLLGACKNSSIEDSVHINVKHYGPVIFRSFNSVIRRTSIHDSLGPALVGGENIEIDRCISSDNNRGVFIGNENIYLAKVCNCTFRDNLYNIFFERPGSNIEIYSSNFFISGENRMIAFEEDMNFVTIRKNLFYANDLASSDFLIDGGPSKEIIIEDNLFYWGQAGFSTMGINYTTPTMTINRNKFVNLEKGVYLLVDGATIHNNYFINNSFGIWTYLSNHNIVNNTFKDCGSGIRIHGDGSNICIRENRFDSCDLAINNQSLKFNEPYIFNNIFNNCHITIYRYKEFTNPKYGFNIGFLSETSGSSIGTGLEQEIIHNLPTIPKNISIIPTETATTINQVWADAEKIYLVANKGKAFNWSAEV